jgi:hypothetical protein
VKKRAELAPTLHADLLRMAEGGLLVGDPVRRELLPCITMLEGVDPSEVGEVVAIHGPLMWPVGVRWPSCDDVRWYRRSALVRVALKEAA